MRKYNLINPDLPVIEEELWAVFDNETGQFVRPLKKEVFESKGAAATAVGLALRYLDIDPEKEKPLSLYRGATRSEAEDQQKRLKAERKKLRDSGRYTVVQVSLSQVFDDTSLDDPTSNLGEILALLNGDGGHRVSEVGYRQATEEAVEVVVDMMNRLAQSPQEIVSMLREYSQQTGAAEKITWSVVLYGDGSGRFEASEWELSVRNFQEWSFETSDEMIGWQHEMIAYIDRVAKDASTL